MSTYRIDVFSWQHKETTCATIRLRGLFLDTHYIEGRCAAENFAGKNTHEYSKQHKASIAITISPRGNKKVFGHKLSILELLSWADSISRACLANLSNGALH